MILKSFASALTIAGLVLFAECASAGNPVYRIAFECQIDGSLYDAPQSMVHPRVSVMLDEYSHRVVRRITDTADDIEMKRLKAPSNNVVDPEIFMAKGVTLTENYNATLGEYEATVLFENPKLQYSCKANKEALDPDGQIYDAMNASAHVVLDKSWAPQVIVLEKYVGGLQCVFATLRSADGDIGGFRCSIVRPLDYKELYENLNVKAVETELKGKPALIKKAGRLACLLSEAEYSCVLSF